MATNPPTAETPKTDASAKIEELKAQALAKKKAQEIEKVEAYKISYDCRTSINGSIVAFRKDDKVSDPAMIVQLKAQGIDMLPIDAECVECPNCKSRFAMEIFKK